MKKGWYYASLITACLAVWLVVDHIAGFTPHDYFYQANPGIKKYVGVNVVSRWADLTFFTYQTMIFFSIWLFALSLGKLLKLKKLYAIATHRAIVVFIQTNYTVTSVLYTVFELASGNPTFGLYAINARAIHNLGTNLLAHYLFFIFCIWIGFKTEKHGKMQKIHYFAFLLYACIYYITTKICGLYCYRIEWYPYPIFDGESLWFTLGFSGYRKWKGVCLLFFTLIVLGGVYVSLLYTFHCIQNKKEHNRRMKTVKIKDDGYSLITGATGGLGKAFVYALAKRNVRLILTGRSEEKLQKLTQELRDNGYTQEIKIFAADLANEASRVAMMDTIAREQLRISTLVNVAGADVQKGVMEYTQEKIFFQCRVNFEAAVSLCRFAIEQKAEHLDIINVSSVSGIYPMPYFAIYSATKGALTSFSSALREEMKGKGVHVSAILPGAMPTREDIKAQIQGQGLWGKLAVKSPQWVAEYSLKVVQKNKRVKIAGFWNKVMRVGTALLPTQIKLKFIARRWSKISKDAF